MFPLVTPSGLNLFFPVTMLQYCSVLLVRLLLCTDHVMSHDFLPRGVAKEAGSRIIGYFPYYSRRDP